MFRLSLESMIESCSCGQYLVWIACHISYVLLVFRSLSSLCWRLCFASSIQAFSLTLAVLYAAWSSDRTAAFLGGFLCLHTQKKSGFISLCVDLFICNVNICRKCSINNKNIFKKTQLNICFVYWTILMFVKSVPVVLSHCYNDIMSWEANPSICPSTYINTFLPSYLSLYCIYLFHCLSSLSHSAMFSLAWHRGTGSVTSSLHRLFPLEAAVGCLLIWSEILNLHLAASYKHRWLWNNELWNLSYSTVYLKDRLPVTTLQSALVVSGTVPVLNLSLVWLDFTGKHGIVL